MLLLSPAEVIRYEGVSVFVEVCVFMCVCDHANRRVSEQGLPSRSLSRFMYVSRDEDYDYAGNNFRKGCGFQCNPTCLLREVLGTLTINPKPSTLDSKP